jgi:hypothetical protein
MAFEFPQETIDRLRYIQWEQVQISGLHGLVVNGRKRWSCNAMTVASAIRALAGFRRSQFTELDGGLSSSPLSSISRVLMTETLYSLGNIVQILPKYNRAVMLCPLICGGEMQRSPGHADQQQSARWKKCVHQIGI